VRGHASAERRIIAFSKRRPLQWVRSDFLGTLGNDLLYALKANGRRLSCRLNTKHHITYKELD
jgi:hypothetical protein